MQVDLLKDANAVVILEHSRNRLGTLWPDLSPFETFVGLVIRCDSMMRTAMYSKGWLIYLNSTNVLLALKPFSKIFTKSRGSRLLLQPKLNEQREVSLSFTHAIHCEHIGALLHRQHAYSNNLL